MLIEVGQSRGVDLAVLPDLEARKMETESLHLPDQALQLSGGIARGTGPGE